MICKLKNNLYSLKQVPKQWYHKFDMIMVGQNYKRIYADSYVDDILIVRQDPSMIRMLKEKLFKSFNVNHQGQQNKFWV